MHTFSTTTTRGGGCVTIDEGDLENTWGGILSNSYSKGGYTLSNGTSIKVPAYKPFAVRKEMKKFIQATDRAFFSHPGENTSGWNFCGEFDFSGFYHITGFSEKNILVSAIENCGEWAAARYNCSSVIDMLNLAVQGDVNLCVVRGSEWSIYSQNRFVREMVVFDTNEKHISVMKCHFRLLKGKKTLKIDNRYLFNGKKIGDNVYCLSPPIFDANFKCTYSWISFKNKQCLFSVFAKGKGPWIENLKQAYPKNVLRTHAWFSKGKKFTPGKYEESKWKGKVQAFEYRECVLTEALLKALKPYRPYYNVMHNSSRKTIEITGYESMFSALPTITDCLIGACAPLTNVRTKDETIAKLCDKFSREFNEKCELEAAIEESKYINANYIDDQTFVDEEKTTDEDLDFGLFGPPENNNNSDFELVVVPKPIDNSCLTMITVNKNVNIIVDDVNWCVNRYIEYTDFESFRPVEANFERKYTGPVLANIDLDSLDLLDKDAVRPIKNSTMSLDQIWKLCPKAVPFCRYVVKHFDQLCIDMFLSNIVKIQTHDYSYNKFSRSYHWSDVKPRRSMCANNRDSIVPYPKIPIAFAYMLFYVKGFFRWRVGYERGIAGHLAYKWRSAKMPEAPPLPPVYHADNVTMFEQDGVVKICGGQAEYPVFSKQIGCALRRLRPIPPPNPPVPIAPPIDPDYGRHQRHFVLGYPIHKTILGETVTDWLLAVIQGRLATPEDEEPDIRGITMRYGDIIYNDTPVEILTLRHVTDDNQDSVGHYYRNNNSFLKTLSRKVTKCTWSWRSKVNRMRGLNPVTGPNTNWWWSPEEQWERFICSAPVFINALLGPQSDISLDEELLALSLKRFVYRCTAVNIDPVANVVDNLQHNSFIAAHWALISMKQQFFERSASTLGAFNLPNLKGRPLLL